MVEVPTHTQYDNENENHYQYMHKEYLNHFFALKEKSISIDSIIILVLIIWHTAQIMSNTRQ